MPRTLPGGRRLVRLKEGAEYISLSPWKLRRLVQTGKIPIVRYDDHAPWLLDLEDLDKWVERNKQFLP
jgi:excisionase family DNA binding protein